jgi:predicted transcriptional regulator
MRDVRPFVLGMQEGGPEVSHTQEVILAYLKDHPGKSIQEIAEALDMNHFTLQASIKGLLKSKLVRNSGMNSYAKLYEAIQ